MVLASHSESLAGGAERGLLDLAVGLKRDGRADPVVTVPRTGGALAVALEAESIRTHVLRTPSWALYRPMDSRGALSIGELVKNVRRALAIARDARPWVHWLRAERPDVVVTSTATIPLPALASAAVGIPHVWWPQEFVTSTHGHRYVLGEPVSRRCIGWLSEVVVPNSMAARVHYSPSIRNEKMRVIYPGIPGFDASPNRIDPGTLRVLLLGQQTRAKGSMLALWALSMLASEAIHVDLRLVGWIEPSFRDELQELATNLGISDRVEIRGATVTPQDEFAWANVVLMCSENEAFGRVTVEALKSGRPVIGARSGATAELIADGKDGVLFEPGNPEELASALRRLAADPGLLARMSESACAAAQERFTIAREVDDFLDVLVSASGQQRHRCGS